MPLLPFQLGSGVAGASSSLVASSLQDIYAVLPLLLHPDDPAPVRDAIFNALLAIVTRYQQRSLFAAQQSDILTAVGPALYQAGSELGVFVQAGETDEAYRARCLLAPAIVTPTAIMAAVNTLLAPFTAIQAVYTETIGDRWFAFSRTDPQTPGGVIPRAYVYSDTSIPRSPDYPDRFYASEAAQNGGMFVPNREPGAARVYADRLGREFMIRVPDISSINAQIATVYKETTPFPTGAFFVGNGTSATDAAFVRQLATTSSTVYAQIINTVTRIKGQSIRWILLVDDNL